MLKTFTVIGIATSVAFASIVLAPMAAMAQTALPADTTGRPSPGISGQLIRPARGNPMVSAVGPAIKAKAKKHTTKHTKVKSKHEK